MSVMNVVVSALTGKSAISFEIDGNGISSETKLFSQKKMCGPKLRIRTYTTSNPSNGIQTHCITSPVAVLYLSAIFKALRRFWVSFGDAFLNRSAGSALRAERVPRESVDHTDPRSLFLISRTLHFCFIHFEGIFELCSARPIQWCHSCGRV